MVCLFSLLVFLRTFLAEHTECSCHLSNHVSHLLKSPTVSCFPQSKSRSPNKRLEGSIAPISSPILPPHYPSGPVYSFPLLPACFTHTGLCCPSNLPALPHVTFPAGAPKTKVKTITFELHFVIRSLKYIHFLPCFHIFTERATTTQ